MTRYGKKDSAHCQKEIRGLYKIVLGFTTKLVAVFKYHTDEYKENLYTKSLVLAVFIGAFFICVHFQNYP